MIQEHKMAPTKLSQSERADLIDPLLKDKGWSMDPTGRDAIKKKYEFGDFNQAGFIFGHLDRDPHFDNVTRRHGYSWGPSGFFERRRGAVSFFIGLFWRKKGLMDF